jgi:hypothetical protein
MSTVDRRSGSERREATRYTVEIDVEWEGSIGRKRGTISDISMNGCFVLSSGEVEDRELVKIILFLSGGERAEFWGEVVNHIYDIGFAMRFTGMNKEQKEFLEKFLLALKK